MVNGDWCRTKGEGTSECQSRFVVSLSWLGRKEGGEGNSSSEEARDLSFLFSLSLGKKALLRSYESTLLAL